MLKFSKIIFLLVGGISLIFVGLLHTIVHFSDLLKPDVHEYLQKEIVILGEAQSMWNTWGIVSFMMGISFITIGLINIAIFIKTPKGNALPTLAVVAMLLYQMGITYVGYEYEQGFQLYGGILGTVLLFAGLIMNKNV
ncbi:MAG: hypothetical protein AAGG68_19770 [Bacteroidota bacterium]